MSAVPKHWSDIITNKSRSDYVICPGGGGEEGRRRGEEEGISYVI